MAIPGQASVSFRARLGQPELRSGGRARRGAGPRAARGFTLLEMVVATTIMGIAVVGLLSGLSGAVRNAARLQGYQRASQLAQLRMNEMLLDQNLPRNTELSGEFDASLTGGMESGWQGRVTVAEMPPAPLPGQTGLDRLELEVWWMENGQRHAMTLDGYRRRALTPEDIPPPAVVTP
ncbi:MAG TPA: type II secretion system protein [Bryobacteraceae bacterium]|nr:type II secretion system protein [Bryobacteraceae bacterium]